MKAETRHRLAHLAVKGFVVAMVLQVAFLVLLGGIAFGAIAYICWGN